mgnify:CR=1 FL=1
MDAKQHVLNKRYLMIGAAVLIVVLLTYNISQFLA